MQKRKRNYKQEYRRRKARGKQLGISLAAARGHARAGERTRPAEIAANPRGPEQSGLKMMKHGSSLKAAARANASARNGSGDTFARTRTRPA